jgi:hypothetical protein
MEIIPKESFNKSFNHKSIDDSSMKKKNAKKVKGKFFSSLL